MRRLPILRLVSYSLLLLILCIVSMAADETVSTATNEMVSTATNETVDVLTIADSEGDWGYPSPYGHYSRGPGYIRMSLIFDTLVWKDQNGFVPALAEDWEYLPDEKAYLFKIRDGVTWNDGEPFTASDVVFTFQYITDHPYQWVDSAIVENAVAINESTVKITLTRDFAPFLDQVAGTLPILPEHVYKDVVDPANFNDPAALTGTGPFKLVNYDKTLGTYLFEAYDDYYQGTPQVKQIKFVKVSDEMAVAALKRGDIDAASIPGETVEDLKSSGFTVIEGAHDYMERIMINHKKAPFSDPKFRQALYYAIDRQDLVNTGLRGFGLAGSAGLYASDSLWYNTALEEYAYDPGKAGELLEELGYTKSEGSDYYTNSSGPLEIELLVTYITERQGELIKNQLDEAGIKVNLRSVEYKTLDNLIREWDFDLALSDVGGLGGDPAILNKLVTDQYSFTSARYDEDAELNGILEKQVVEMDQEKRKDLIFQAQEIIARDLPSLPLFFYDSFWASNERVGFYYTYGGVGSGVPIAMNKMIFV